MDGAREEDEAKKRASFKAPRHVNGSPGKLLPDRSGCGCGQQSEGEGDRDRRGVALAPAPALTFHPRRREESGLVADEVMGESQHAIFSKLKHRCRVLEPTSLEGGSLMMT